MLSSALLLRRRRQQIKDFPIRLQPLGRRAPRPAAFGTWFPSSRPVPGGRREAAGPFPAQGQRGRAALTAGGRRFPAAEAFPPWGGGSGGSPWGRREDPAPRLPVRGWTDPHPELWGQGNAGHSEPWEDTTPGEGGGGGRRQIGCGGSPRPWGMLRRRAPQGATGALWSLPKAWKEKLTGGCTNREGEEAALTRNSQRRVGVCQKGNQVPPQGSPVTCREPLREGQSSLERGGKAPTVRIHFTGTSLSHWSVPCQSGFSCAIKKVNLSS